MIGLGLSIPQVAVRGAPAPYVPANSQTVAFFGRLATQPSNARAALYDTLIGALVTAGVWSLLDVLYLLAASDSATALTNLASASFGATAVSSPAFTANRGYAGNGSTSYINSNYDPSTAGGQYSLNSGHMAVWDMTVRAGTNTSFLCGRHPSSGGEILIAPHFSGPNTYCRINDSLTGMPDTVSNGFFTASRTSSSLVTGYLNGSSFGTKSNSTGPVGAGNLFIGASNNAGAPFLPSTDQVSCFCAGGGLTSTQVAALYNAIHAYMQSAAGVA